MALLDKPPFHESFDPNQSEQWRVWLRDVWARINSKLTVGGTLTEGKLLTVDSDGEAVSSDANSGEVVENDTLHTYTGERYLTENLLPEAGTEPTDVKCYACMGIDTTPRRTAASYTEVSGATIASGTVADTRTVNQTYLQVEEDQKFDIQFTFTGLSGTPAKCEFIGRYEGNPAHDVWLYIWNYNAGPAAWERVTAAAQDFTSSATDESLIFDLPNTSDYVSGGEAQLRIYHNSVAVAAHDIYIDFIDITESSLSFTNAGEVVQSTGYTDLAVDNIDMDSSAGEMTIQVTGDYENLTTVSFGGTPLSVVTLDLYVNGTKAFTMWERRLNDEGDVGNASSSAIRRFNAGDVLTWRYSSDRDGSYVSIIAGRNTVKKVDYTYSG